MDRRDQLQIVLVTGEVSADVSCAELARMLLKRNPSWMLHALSGPHLGRAVNGTWIGDTSNCSAIGICSAAAIYPAALRLRGRLRRFVRDHSIAAAVLCDWGYFNCDQLPFFRRQQVPVLYYFPPRAWQRTGRAGLQFAPLATRVATPFEWSARRLRAAGCQAEWVGHPIIEQRAKVAIRAQLRAEFGVADDEKLVAIFPGSRHSELRLLVPRLSDAVRILRQNPKRRFLAAVPQEFAGYARERFPECVKVAAGRAWDALVACDAVITKSGSATLEAAVLGAPQVVVYDVDFLRRLEWVLLWSWKRIPFIAMPNIILQRKAVPELVGPDCHPEAIASAVDRLLVDDCLRNRMLHDYEEVRRAVGEGLAKAPTERVAEIVEEMVQTGHLATAGTQPQSEA